MANRGSEITIKAVQRESDVNALQIFTNGTGIVWSLVCRSVIVVGKQILGEIHRSTVITNLCSLKTVRFHVKNKDKV